LIICQEIRIEKDLFSSLFSGYKEKSRKFENYIFIFVQDKL